MDERKYPTGGRANRVAGLIRLIIGAIALLAVDAGLFVAALQGWCDRRSEAAWPATLAFCGFSVLCVFLLKRLRDYAARMNDE
ncbi:MAG TPA: hypothetical protein VGM37_14690 [Armatimonadota bacterium]|jgi:hypothetical protein